jgi:ATP-dependent DNA helicase RecQ
MSAFLKKVIDLVVSNVRTFEGTNKIIVLRGIPSEIKCEFEEEKFADFQTFSSESGNDIFNKDWFTQVFTKLTISLEPLIISDSQFQYLNEYIDPSFFKDRVVIIEDNVRNLFPLEIQYFIQGVEEENTELRDNRLPVHHAEQLKVGEKTYFIPKIYNEEYRSYPIFNSTKTIPFQEKEGLVLDVNDEFLSLDLFINDLLSGNNFSGKVGISLSEKNPVYNEYSTKLEKLNFVLSSCGIELYFIKDAITVETFTPSKELKNLLHAYWGENANFRNLTVYKNPETSSDTIEISQGKVVQLIIDEYNCSREGKKYRDLLLTAPTGAGKSLLFQLPAFHISHHGDVSIVVSPLIALMKDQVSTIINERNFQKAAYINSTLSLIERERVIDSCKKGEIDILYLSPELLLSYDVSYFLGERKLGLLVVDEAHLITTWGRDFRVDYWFLGNHVRKIRVQNGHSFPMVAVTATAIYGGSNDMVFDTEASLIMQNPHRFIGSVKRKNIEFVINNYEKFEQGYEKKKMAQTIHFIDEISNKTNLKSLVYAPYSSHVRNIHNSLLANQNFKSAIYFGSLDKSLKDHSYTEFLNGDKQIMISTKAFGMGVDIPDIQVVYHHAPSGLLPDYVQEVGRLARIPGLKGYAALNYSEQDKWFTKALHGMSAIKPYQLQEVLKKIHNLYLKQKNQNLLLSVDEFSHIFDNSDTLDSKVLTALMMIEKDYIAKYRFSVLIARPKKLFVKSFARVKENQLPQLKARFGNTIEVLPYSIMDSKGYKILRINLDDLWEKYYSNESFPMLKYKFYSGTLFGTIADTLVPQLRVSYWTKYSKRKIQDEVSSNFIKLRSAFDSLGNGFFTEEEFNQAIKNHFRDESTAIKISGFILSNFSGKLLYGDKLEENAFLGRRNHGKEIKFRIISNLYNREFSKIESKLQTTLDDNLDESFRYITNSDSNSMTYIRIGQFLELFDLGSYEIKGGDNPMIFLRLNDPRRIEKDSNGYYKNFILKKTLERHYLSNHIFDHFFLNEFSNDERWDFIEEFFLGKDIDELFERFPARPRTNEINIIEYLIEKDITGIPTLPLRNVPLQVQSYLPEKNHQIKSNTLLTLETDKGPETLSVSKWLQQNPVLIHQVGEQYNFKYDDEVFKVMLSRIRDTEYWVGFRGLQLLIEFPKYSKPVKAIVPYKDFPVEFYLWWKTNPKSVKLTFKEKVDLILKVGKIAQQKLKNEDRKYLST